MSTKATSTIDARTELAELVKRKAEIAVNHICLVILLLL